MRPVTVKYVNMWCLIPASTFNGAIENNLRDYTRSKNFLPSSRRLYSLTDGLGSS